MYVCELDNRMSEYLQQHYTFKQDHFFGTDILQLDFETIFKNDVSLIGNFPYNISTEILFKILDNKERVPEVVGMFQKEVAERLAARPRNKTYGVTSVLLQAYYDIEYLFTVNEEVFNPPPKVKSAVIRLTRNKMEKLNCDEKLFKRIVKAGFNQRRKTLRNALKSIPIKIQFLLQISFLLFICCKPIWD